MQKPVFKVLLDLSYLFFCLSFHNNIHNFYLKGVVSHQCTNLYYYSMALWQGKPHGSLFAIIIFCLLLIIHQYYHFVVDID